MFWQNSGRLDVGYLQIILCGIHISKTSRSRLKNTELDLKLDFFCLGTSKRHTLQIHLHFSKYGRLTEPFVKGIFGHFYILLF